MTAWQNNTTPRVFTLLLVLIAFAGWTLVRTGAAWNPALMTVRALVELGVTLSVSFYLCRRAKSLRQAKAYVALAAGAAATYPFIAEFSLRQLAGGSEPFEMLLLTSLQLTAIVLAVFSQVPRLAGTSVLFSSFLFLFITTMPSNQASLLLAAVFGALVLWWLMGAYWDRLADSFVASRVERRIPLRVSVIGGTVVVLLLVVAMIGTTGSATIALKGFMPTSGGTQWYDQHAQSGVGDGDAMVAAKDEAMSFGPVESELFLESQMPSLYDLFNDIYGDPPKPNNQWERAISLAPENFMHTHQRIAESKRSGRDFSTVRRTAERRQQTLDDQDSPAMLYVVGRVPLHLALERFDTFNGRTWGSSGLHVAQQPIRLEERNGRTWAYLMDIGQSRVHRGIESHAVKFVNVKSNRFPSPPQLLAVHVDKVSDSDFFGWSDDGVACMPVREHIPQLTVAHIRSHGLNLQSLREDDFTKEFPTFEGQRSVSQPTDTEIETEQIARHLHVASSNDLLIEIANDWTDGIPRGWRQVEAVVDRLRRDFVLDPNAETPEDCMDVVSHFLEVRRGPDYMFASTAAILLRELGYPTRFVSGFYADKKNYDHRAGQTTVFAEDVHVWVEVKVDRHTWVPIEPTPGYQAPRESLTWRQYLARAWVAFWTWCFDNLIFVLLVLTLSIASWFTRVYWLNGVLTLGFRMAGRVDNRRRALWSIRLLEWRAWLVGHPRPKCKTLSCWHGTLVESLPEATAVSLQSVLRSADSLLYNSRHASERGERNQELVAACNVVDHRVGTKCFRQAFANEKAEAKR